ncbi:MAG: AmmeMemoRadiSam system protein B [Planctomycetota bacterium]
MRPAVVAGAFYPSSASELIKVIQRFIDKRAKKENIIAAFVPHAGYVYSGRVAGAVFSHIVIPPKVIIVAPNHTGMGARISLFPEGSWEIPTGLVEIDSELNDMILKKCPLVKKDVSAHQREHSAEVQVPFLRYLRSDVKISVISIATHDYPKLDSIGVGLAQVVKEAGKENILLLASTDMTHFESHSTATEKDKLAIDKILALDAQGLLQTVTENDISMCGVGPSTAVLRAAVLLEASQARLIRYETSGDITADKSNVVGYAGIIVK